MNWLKFLGDLFFSVHKIVDETQNPELRTIIWYKGQK
jgi:hypothetical protein